MVLDPALTLEVDEERIPSLAAEVSAVAAKLTLEFMRDLKLNCHAISCFLVDDLFFCPGRRSFPAYRNLPYPGKTGGIRACDSEQRNWATHSLGWQRAIPVPIERQRSAN
jgi:hypothetical protein